MVKTSRTTTRQDLDTVHPGAAAIDIGSTMHSRAFGTFTQDLHDLAEWFRACGVTSVAMESNGVYWIPAFEILEQHGFEVFLVNARYAKPAQGVETCRQVPVQQRRGLIGGADFPLSISGRLRLGSKTMSSPS